MSKKTIVIIVIFLLIVSGLGFVFKDKLGFFKSEGSSLGLDRRKVDKKEKTIDFVWASWEDPAGFSFDYPQEATIDAHLEDEVNYANLEITSEGKKGKIIILCNDSQYIDIDDWLEKDQLVRDGSGLETEIASMSARKVALGEGREVVGFIDWDEVLYTVDFQPEEEVDYWRSVFNHLLQSFELIPLEGETEAQFEDWLKGFDTSSADIVEPVEIIE